MTEEYLIIGDIAGQYEALIELVKQAPNAIPLGVGDLFDRGPESKKVFEFFKQNGKSLLGNHEHMLLQFYHKTNYYESDVWLYWNGGRPTARSFMGLLPGEDIDEEELRDTLRALGVIDYLESLPLYFELPPRELDGLKGLVTHAPKPSFRTLEKCCDLGKGFNAGDLQFQVANYSLIWNRTEPEEIKNTLQIFGHNSPWGHCWFQGDLNGKVVDENAIPWGVCLDSSKEQKLTGLHWPSLEVYHAGYL